FAMSLDATASVSFFAASSRLFFTAMGAILLKRAGITSTFWGSRRQSCGPQGECLPQASRTAWPRADLARWTSPPPGIGLVGNPAPPCARLVQPPPDEDFPRVWKSPLRSDLVGQVAATAFCGLTAAFFSLSTDPDQTFSFRRGPVCLARPSSDSMASSTGL